MDAKQDTMAMDDFARYAVDSRGWQLATPPSSRRSLPSSVKTAHAAYKRRQQYARKLTPRDRDRDDKMDVSD